MLRNRISDLSEFSAKSELSSDEVNAIGSHIINNLREVFGHDSPEFDRYENWRMSGLPGRVVTGFEDPRREAARKQQGLRSGIEKTVTELESVIRQLEEKKAFLPMSGHAQEYDSREAKVQAMPAEHSIVINNYGVFNTGKMEDIRLIKINVAEVKKEHPDLARNFEQLTDAVQLAVLPEEQKERALDCIGELTTELAKPEQTRKKWKLTEKLESLGKLLTAGANAYDGYEKVQPHLQAAITAVRSLFHI